MSERLAIGYEFDTTREQAIQDLGQEALRLMDDRYSTGHPHFRGGSERKLGFNNGRHARKVARDTVRVGSAVGLTPAELLTGEAAARAHDVVQLRGRGTDEREAAQWFEDEVRRLGVFPEAVAKIGSLAILGTLPIFADGIIVDQTANVLDYPSKAAEKIAKSLASADLGELYTPMGPYLSHRLFAQLQGLEPSDTPDMSDIYDFHLKQIQLLESHHYPLAKAESILATHRSEVLAYNYRLLEQLHPEHGTIHSWRQLIRQDLEFMREHS